MSGKKFLFGGPVFDGESLWERGTVLFDGSGIIEVREGTHVFPGSDGTDVQGRWVMPGLVDLHSDAIERCVEMRPGVHFDVDFALRALDQRLAACGITTFCHALSFSDNDFGLRNAAAAERLVEIIAGFGAHPHRRVNHCIHARCEVTCPEVLPTLERLIDRRFVHLFSLTDHTPGQGQFKSMEAYLKYQAEMYGATREEALAAAGFKTRQKTMGLDHIGLICEKVSLAGIPMLSHDDDTPEKVHLVERLGVGACEFPVNMEAIRAARGNGMEVFMGAPNLLRDGSSNGHIKASEVILSGDCDGLVSDYYPECLLQAPFVAHRRCGLPLKEALALVTGRPGRFLSRTQHFGRLAPGAPADILVVDPGDDWARVLQTWVSGRLVFRQDI
jgi:alpha-D-ribose 1-methylphosphonate 5-triphosphate diphosphatase